MYSFILGVISLILGYVFLFQSDYQKFGVEPDRETSAIALEDGTDFVPMKKEHNWRIQLLNIEGTGPISDQLWEPCTDQWLFYGLYSVVSLLKQFMIIIWE